MTVIISYKQVVPRKHVMASFYLFYVKYCCSFFNDMKYVDLNCRHENNFHHLYFYPCLCL